MDKKYFNDNYNLVYSDTMIITTTFAHSVAILIYLPVVCIAIAVALMGVGKIHLEENCSMYNDMGS